MSARLSPTLSAGAWAQSLETPCLVLDVAAMRHNIEAMAAFAKARGLALRPHAKTHKSADIAALQVAAGAVGVCCAKLAEAEALAMAGYRGSILLTSPVVGDDAIARLIRLHAQLDGLRCVVDHPRPLMQIATHAVSERPLDILIDIDPGIHRTGVTSAQGAVDLARQIAGSESLRFAGIQFYCGMQQHIPLYADRRAALEERTTYLQSVISALREAGHPPAIVTGSGTGSFAIDAALGVFTELQCGSYVFLDRQYQECELLGDGAPAFAPALFVASRVISANTVGLATIDGGYKAFSADAGPPAIITGPFAGARVIFMGDEHCAVVSEKAPTAPGEVVLVQPPHCDPTVNLYDAYVLVEGDAVVGRWSVTARGRSA